MAIIWYFAFIKKSTWKVKTEPGSSETLTRTDDWDKLRQAQANSGRADKRQSQRLPWAVIESAARKMTLDKGGASAAAVDFPVELADVVKEFQVRSYNHQTLHYLTRLWLFRIFTIIKHDATHHLPLLLLPRIFISFFWRSFYLNFLRTYILLTYPHIYKWCSVLKQNGTVNLPIDKTKLTLYL